MGCTHVIDPFCGRVMIPLILPNLLIPALFFSTRWRISIAYDHAQGTVLGAANAVGLPAVGCELNYKVALSAPSVYSLHACSAISITPSAPSYAFRPIFDLHYRLVSPQFARLSAAFAASTYDDLLASSTPTYGERAVDPLPAVKNSDVVTEVSALAGIVSDLTSDY
jgi:hypothetical protein